MKRVQKQKKIRQIYRKTVKILEKHGKAKQKWPKIGKKRQRY